MQKLLGSGTDIKADFSKAGTTQEQIDRIAGLYLGDFSRRIKLARDDYTLATRRATIMPGKAEGMDVTETSALVSAIYNGYTYDQVGAEQALRELGHTPGENAIHELRTALPPAQFSNVTAAALRAGITVRRKDFEQIYAAAMLQTLRKKEDKCRKFS